MISSKTECRNQAELHCSTALWIINNNYFFALNYLYSCFFLSTKLFFRIQSKTFYTDKVKDRRSFSNTLSVLFKSQKRNWKSNMNALLYFLMKWKKKPRQTKLTVATTVPFHSYLFTISSPLLLLGPPSFLLLFSTALQLLDAPLLFLLAPALLALLLPPHLTLATLLLQKNNGT